MKSLISNISYIRKTEQEWWFAVIRLKSYLIANPRCRIRHTSFSRLSTEATCAFGVLLPYQYKAANQVRIREDTRCYVALDTLSCNWNSDTLIIVLPNKLHCSFVCCWPRQQIAKSSVWEEFSVGEQKRHSRLISATTWKTEIIPPCNFGVIFTSSLTEKLLFLVRPTRL